MHATATLAEADRLMTLCNSCRYCEGLCAVFPAMEMRRAFPDGDLNYLANLCHGCGACYYDCQFSPPHEFNVNVPRVFAKARADSYAAYTWPRAFAPMFARNGLAISLVAAFCVAAFILGFVGWQDRDVIFGINTGPGAFFKLMPHRAMVTLFGAAFVYAFVAMAMEMLIFWRDIGEPMQTLARSGPLLDAVRDTFRLRYLEGGKMGCFNEDERPTDRRRIYHHLTFYGFLLCFASTSVASLYHYLGREAPYAWYELPVLLGTIGGIGLLIGPVGLLSAKLRRDPDMLDKPRLGMDIAFIAMLFLTSLTGLALLVFRGSPAMGILLAVHLGFVFAFFITMPYGKFVHGLYRFAALIRYAKESRALHDPEVPVVAASAAVTGQGGSRPW
jgi:citrate/tricarballylate utilization protein